MVDGSIGNRVVGSHRCRSGRKPQTNPMSILIKMRLGVLCFCACNLVFDQVNQKNDFKCSLALESGRMVEFKLLDSLLLTSCVMHS